MAVRSSDSAIAAIEIAPLRPGDRAEWEHLARGYKAFYEDPIPDEHYARTWHRLMAGEIKGFGARLDGPMVGISHYFFHPHCWRGEVCYLQDLFTVVEARGRGVARALVETVAEAARERGAAGLYWVTREDNLPARALYERLAQFKGFIRYDFPL